MIELKLKKISNTNFEAFGTYIEGPAGEPTYSNERFRWWNEAYVADLGGRISFGFVQPVYFQDYSQSVFEKHDLTPEILIPLDNDIIIAAAEPDAFDSEIRGERMGAFLVPAGAVVVLKPGIWHYAPMTLSKKATVLVAFKEKTSDCDKVMMDLSDKDCFIKIIL